MRKHFLILMLMALLPFTAWAADLEANGTLKALSPYYGQALTPVEVTFGSSTTPLTVDVDYTFDGYFTSEACTAATKIEEAAILAAPAGKTYYAKVTGINGYEGSLKASFEVKKMPLKLTGTQGTNAKKKTFGETDPVETETDKLYVVTGVLENITSGAQDLTTDFAGKITFARKPGEDAKTYDIVATITDATLAKNYTIASADITTNGSDPAVFTINAKNLSATDITVAAIDPVTFKGSAWEPALTVKDGNTVLKVDNTSAHAKDYYVSYSANTGAGTAHATINGTKNYTGTKVVDFTINKALVLVTPSATKEYDGTNDFSDVTYTYQGFVDNTTATDVSVTAAPTAEGLVTSGENIGKVAKYVLNINSGATFTTLGNNYSFTFEPGTFEITKKKINVVVANKLDQLYGATEVFDVTSASAVTGSLVSGHGEYLKLALKGEKIEKAANNTEDYDFDLVPAFRNPTEITAAITAAELSTTTTPTLADANKWVKLMKDFYEIDQATSTKGKLKYTNAALTIALDESAYTDFYKEGKLQKVYDGQPITITLDKTNGVKIIGKKNNDNIDLTNLVLTVEDNSANVKRLESNPTKILPYRLTLSGAKAEHYNISYVPSAFYINPRPIGLSYGKQAFRTNTVPTIAQNYTYETILDTNNKPVAEQGLVSTDKAADAFKLGFDNTKVSVNTTVNDPDYGKITQAVANNIANAIIPVDPKTEGSVFANYAFTVKPGSGVVDILAAATRALNEKTDLTTLTASTYDENVLLESDRQIKKNVWASLVLPFNTSVRKVSEALGYAVVDMFDEDPNSDAMNFKLYMGEIPAYTPFLVKTDETINLNTVVFESVKIVKLTDENRGNLTQSNKSYNFVGNMKYGEVGVEFWSDGAKMTEESIVFNKFRGTSNCRAMKAYITAKAGVSEAPIINIEEADGTITSINSVTAEKINAVKEGWYTLNGVKLQGVPTQKGIYINNGKKVVIK